MYSELRRKKEKGKNDTCWLNKLYRRCRQSKSSTSIKHAAESDEGWSRKFVKVASIWTRVPSFQSRALYPYATIAAKILEAVACCASVICSLFTALITTFSSVGRRGPLRHGLSIPRLGLAVRNVKVLGRSDPILPGLPPGSEPGHGCKVRERAQVCAFIGLEPATLGCGSWWRPSRSLL